MIHYYNLLSSILLDDEENRAFFKEALLPLMNMYCKDSGLDLSLFDEYLKVSN